MPVKYILDDADEPRPCVDIKTWGQWMKAENCRLALDELEDGTEVSTVFLGLDHRFSPGPPLLWETCVFRPDRSTDVRGRYSSRLEAVAGHVDAVAEELRRIHEVVSS